MTNILAIAISAPPKTGAESIQTARYLKFLSTNSEITLITTKPSKRGWKKSDASLKAYKTYINKTIEIEDYQGLVAKFEYFNWIKNHIIIPDSDFLFHHIGIRSGNIFDRKYDVIYSRSTPFSSALLAFSLKLQLNIPWIAHFSDPWYGNPYNEFSAVKNEKIRILEKKIVASADSLHLTSNQTIDIYKERYPGLSDKFKYSPNVYDPDKLNTKPIIWHERMKISYIGNLYKSRNLKTLLCALDHIKNESPQIFTQIEFIIAGNMDEYNQKLINDYHALNIKYLGHLDFEKSLEIMHQSDVLLTVDKIFEDPLDLAFFPSKLMDYYCSKRLIIGISNTDSPTFDFVNKVGGKCFQHSDHIALGHFLFELVKAYQNKNEKVFNKDINDDFFSAKYQSRILLDEMQNFKRS